MILLILTSSCIGCLSEFSKIIYLKGDVMKRLLSVLLVLALLLSLAACGKENTNSEKTGSENTSSIEEVVDNSPVPSVPVIPENVEQPQFTPSTEDVYDHELVRYELNDECVGYYFTPKAKGSYPTIIMIHGQGSVKSFKERLLSNFNNWVKLGYIPPMVVVIPEVLDYTGGGSNIDDFQYYIYSSQEKRFNALLTSIEEGTLSPQIDTSKAPYVAGFSMGGMAAVHAGAEYNTRIKHVGGLSPAKSFYLGEALGGFYNKAADIHFSTDADARVYLSAGQFEQGGEFLYTVNRYEKGIKVNNPNIVTKFVAPLQWGTHSWQLAQKEIFMYLYFIAFDKVPSNELVEAVCPDPDAFKIPRVISKEPEHK